MLRSAIGGLLVATCLAAAPQGTGATPLHDAVWQGDEAEVSRLIDQGAAVDARHTEGGSTPLLFAVLRGNLPIIRLLLARGADIRARNNSGATVLHLSAGQRDATLTRALLEAGADPGLRDGAGLKPLDQAAQAGAAEVVTALLDRTSDDGSALALVADPGTATALLDRGHYRPPQLAAALLRASTRNEPALARLVLARGADPNTHGALDAAVTRGNTDAVQALLNAGAKTGSQIYEAALQGHAAIIRLLASHGAAIDAPDPATGTTPLYAAASLGHLEAAKALLDLGANPTLVAKSGRTPLQAAEASKFEAVADLLRNFPGTR